MFEIDLEIEEERMLLRFLKEAKWVQRVKGSEKSEFVANHPHDIANLYYMYEKNGIIYFRINGLDHQGKEIKSFTFISNTPEAQDFYQDVFEIIEKQVNQDIGQYISFLKKWNEQNTETVLVANIIFNKENRNDF